MKVGLIGSGISRSSSPRLHIFLGDLYGVKIDYHSIDSMGQPDFDFDATLDRCAREGFRGTNVTHPFKVEVCTRVRIDDPFVAGIGALNTVTFDADGWRGANTDCSGFANAFRHHFGSVAPGTVVMAGAGGVSRAIGFALAQLGATRIQVLDIVGERASELVAGLTKAGLSATALSVDEFPDAVRAADGLVNGTPVGMWKSPGNPFPAEAVGGQRWAFDAVYTPLETEFLACARTAGLELMSGYELFLFQGFDGFSIFTGKTVDPAEAMAKFPPPQ